MAREGMKGLEGEKAKGKKKKGNLWKIIFPPRFTAFV